MKGRVSGGLAREVTVQLATSRGWMTMASTTSSRDGRYRVAVPTDWYYSGRVRAAAPAVRVGDVLHQAAAATGEAVRVAAPYRTRGKASDWSTLLGGSRVVSRWDPCRTITWKVNTAGAPAGALGTVKRALRLVHAATGLSFRYGGRTRAIPYRTDGGKQWDRDADLVIAWASPRQKREFKGRWSAIGYGGHSSSNGESVRGGVVLDRTWNGRRGFPGASWGSLLLHEIGHAVGLGHAAGPTQVMYWQMQRDASGRYEAGDLAGLRRLGAANGCLPDEDTANRRSAERLVTVVSE